MRLAGLLACSLLAPATSWLAPAPALAGTYQVTACQPPGGGSSAFAPVQLGDSFSLTRDCPPSSGSVLSGLVAQDLSGTGGGSPGGARGGWAATAVPGTTITAITGRRHFGKRDPDWSVGPRTAQGQLLETCQIIGALACSVGSSSSPTHPENSFAFSGLSTSSIAFDFICEAPASSTCSRNVDLHQVWMVLYEATITIDDPAPPALGPISGSLLGPGATGGWHRGSESATVQSSDVSGIRQTRLLVDDTTRELKASACDYTTMRPCPASVSELLTLNLATVGEGTHSVRFGVTDAAGQETLSAPQPLKVDQSAPLAPRALQATRNPDGTWRVAWTNPSQGTAAPIVAAHYLVCQPGSSSDCPTGEIRRAAGITQLAATVPAGGGPWDILVWLQDEAGNHDPTSAARIAVNTSRAITAPPPPPPPPVAPPPPQLRTKRTPRLTLTAVRSQGRTLLLSGRIRTTATGRLAITVRASSRGRVLARGSARARRGRWQMRARLPARAARARRAHITVRYLGDRLHGSQTVTRTLARTAASTRSGGDQQLTIER